MSVTPSPRLQTSFCELVGVKYPIVQTGMGWVAGPKLVSATANAGALGILASATMDLDQLKSSIAEVKSRTTKPFGVNLRADSADVKDRISLMIDEGIKVASFAQAPKPDLISHLKDAGVVVIPSIGAKRHAEKVLEWGVDAVLVQVAKVAATLGLSQPQFYYPKSWMLLRDVSQSLLPVGSLTGVA